MKHLWLVPAILFISLSCNEQVTTTHEPAALVASENKPTIRSPFTDTTAALFAQLTYCPGPQQQLDQYAPGWKIVWNPAPINGNYAFVATDGEKYVLAIRGSVLSFSEDAFNNWVYHDLNIAVQNKWPYSGNEKARVSRGSYTGWQNMEKMKDKVTGKTLWAFLSENVKKETPLFLCGHSLGGNLAVVYSAYLWFKFTESGSVRPAIQVITFAAPAAGNRPFAEDFDKKFPAAVRIENSNDVVAKFPCTDRMKKLENLFTDGPSATRISIGYNNISTTLSSAFTTIATMLDLLELGTGFSGYCHTSHDGKQITIALSGNNRAHTASDWFAEAGYQHSMERYAAAVGAPVINCTKR